MGLGRFVQGLVVLVVLAGCGPASKPSVAAPVREARVDAGSAPDELAGPPGLGVAKVVAEAERLPYRVVDAGFSASLDRLVFLSEQPAAVHIYDARKRKSQRVALEGTPHSLSVSPDGRQAAALLLSPNARRSTAFVIDVASARVVSTFGPSERAWHGLTLLDDRLLGFGPGRVHSFDLRSKLETESLIQPEVWSVVLDPSSGRLNALFDNAGGLSLGALVPEGGQKLKLEYGGYPINCGALWLSATPGRAFNSCGAVLKPQQTKPQQWDLDRLLLRNTRIQGLAEQPGLRELAVILAPERAVRLRYPVSEDAEVRILSADDYSTVARGLLPGFVSRGRTFNAHGRAIFAARSGDAYYVLAEADAAAQLEHAFAIVTLPRGADRAGFAPDARQAAGFAEAYAEKALERPRASSWQGVSALTEAERDNIERFRRLGKRPRRDVQEDEEAALAAKEDAEPIPRGDPPPPKFPLAGQRWRGNTGRDGGVVTSGTVYDSVRFGDESDGLRCIVSVQKPDLLLRMLETLLSPATVTQSYVLSSSIYTMSAHGPPLFVWRLGPSMKPKETDVFTTVMGVVDAERGALCAYQRDLQPTPWIDTAAELLDELVWDGVPRPDYEEFSVAWSTVPNVLLSKYQIVSKGGAKWTYTTSGSVDYVGGLSRAQIRLGATEQLAERYFFVAPGEKLRALRDYELVTEGNADDVLVAAAYRSRAGAKREDLALTREAQATYRIVRPGSTTGQRLVTDRDLAGPLLSATRLRAVHNDTAFDFTLHEFVPEASTGRALPVKYLRRAGEKLKDLTITTPTATNRAALGSDGRMDAIFPQSNRSFRLERKSRHGCGQPMRLLPEKLRARLRSGCDSK